jgi:4-hydroxy-tetrahydrodipicolinate synthase
MLHERHIRSLHALPRPVSVLTTHSSWLMASLTLGPDGLLSGAGSVIADLQVALFRAVQARDLERAQAINDRIYPLAQAFYVPPFLDMHNRMKECLVLLGRLEKAVVRPPLTKLPAAEIERLRNALRAAGLLDAAAPVAAE